MYKILFCSLLVAVGLACAFCVDCEPEYRLEDTIGLSAFTVMAHPDRVAMFKVTPKPEYSVSEKVALNREQIEELCSLLLDDASYTFDIRKKCLFLPEVGFTFENEAEVTVLVSPLGNQIRVISEDKNEVIDYDPVAEQLNPLINNMITQESL